MVVREDEGKELYAKEKTITSNMTNLYAAQAGIIFGVRVINKMLQKKKYKSCEYKLNRNRYRRSSCKSLYGFESKLGE